MADDGKFLYFTDIVWLILFTKLFPLLKSFYRVICYLSINCNWWTCFGYQALPSYPCKTTDNNRWTICYCVYHYVQWPVLPIIYLCWCYWLSTKLLLAIHCISTKKSLPQNLNGTQWKLATHENTYLLSIWVHLSY